MKRRNFQGSFLKNQKGWFQKIRKEPVKYFLVIAILLLTLIKLDLLGAGFRSLIDEFRYGRSGVALINLSELNFAEAIDAIFSTHGRPADALIKTIPNAIQFVTGNFLNLEYYESKNSSPLFLFNFLTYCLILIVHYKFSKLLLKDDVLALFSVFSYSALTNSHLYLRHAFPYDTSLLVFYLIILNAFKHIEKKKFKFKKSLFLGFFSFFAFLIYPGYFPLYFVVVFLFFFLHFKSSDFSLRVKHTFLFGVGSLVCLLIFEGLSRVGGGSYIKDAVTLSSTITQGNFEESFSFLFKYLLQVEKITGILLVNGLVFFFLSVIYLFWKKKIDQNLAVILLVFFPLLLMFLAYASAGYFFEKMVFYGRLLHQYLPFLCFFSLVPLLSLSKKLKKRNWGILILSVFLLLDFGLKFSELKAIAYPRDVFWQITKENNPEDIKIICEFEPFWPVVSDSEYALGNLNELYDTPLPKVLFINGCYMYDVSDFSGYQKFNPDSTFKMTFSKPHFINFKAYQFEGFSIIARQNMDQNPFFIRVFKKKNESNF